MSKAILMLEDGTSFVGQSSGAAGEIFGELCFTTSMVGYPEVLSDPSYAGQIVTMTYPQIGNYGVARADLQRDELALRGLVVREICTEPSNFRSDLSLSEFLLEQDIVTISEVDTRAIVRHIRDNGAMKAGISTLDFDEASLLAKVKAAPSLVEKNLAQTVSVKAPQRYTYDPEPYRFIYRDVPAPTRKVVAYDCGAKYSILRNLVRAGSEVELVPWDTPAAEVLAKEPDGVFFSNGPGDPGPVEATITAARELLGKVPVFGICLGHQIIGRAVGAQTEKLKFGHRGGNQPVMNLYTNKVEITAQNHGFGIVFESLGPLVPELSGGETVHTNDMRKWVEKRIAPVVETAEFGRVQLTHVNLNDGTPEGLAFLDLPAFCVQYHPEASPGPTDAHNLFTAFSFLMDGREDYLNIDISINRLKGWK